MLLLRSFLSLSAARLGFFSLIVLAFSGRLGVYFLGGSTASGVVLCAVYRGIGLSVVLSFADAPQPMSFYKFIVNAIKSNPYNMLINYSLLFIQMQAKNIDTLKFSLSLLHKLKNYESIDINNRLINIGISSITSKQLKLLI